MQSHAPRCHGRLSRLRPASSLYANACRQGHCTLMQLKFDINFRQLLLIISEYDSDTLCLTEPRERAFLLMFRTFIPLLLGVLVITARAAVQVPVSAPDTYMVRHSDTLWSISARLLSKPWLWPEIWQANRRIYNPHLIYPGEVIKLSLSAQWRRVRKLVIPTRRLEPRIRREAVVAPEIPLSQLKMFLPRIRVLDSKMLESAPYVVGVEENQLRGAVGQNIYVRKLKSRPGQRWAIVRPSHIFRRFSYKNGDREIKGHLLDSNVMLGTSPWLEDTGNDGHSGRELGVEVTVLGRAETLRMGDPSTLLLLGSGREIRVGDRIVALDEYHDAPEYHPHPPARLPAHARVIALTGAMAAVGVHQVVVLSIGRAEGVNNGTRFAVWHPGIKVSDVVIHKKWTVGGGKRVRLPDEYVAHVMVFRSFRRISYALVMDALGPVRIGDKLRLP